MRDVSKTSGAWDARVRPPGRPGAALHVWGFDLGPRQDAAALRRLLSPEETARAARLRSAALQRRFVVSRARLREILGSYLELEGADLVFAYGPNGKPRLGDGTRTHDSTGLVAQIAPLAFNLTHSRDLALCAVSELGEVGVDLEGVRPLKDAARLAQRHFSPEEFRRWAALESSGRLDGFYRVWTRKEALLKAAGVGLSRPLERVDSDRGTVDDGSFWLADLDLDELETRGPLRAAVACEREPSEIHRWTWGGDTPEEPTPTRGD